MSKVWFITGGSRGLGRSIVETALKAGDRVVATARDVSRFDDLVAVHGDHVLPLRLDVAVPEEAEGAVRQAMDTFGRLDVVVNNAGYADMSSVEDTTAEDFRAQIETNFFGVVHVTKAVLPILREQGSGHLIQVSSVGSRVGTPGLGAYQSAKWAVSGLTSVLALELAPLGIQVTAVEPGGMTTEWAGSSMAVPPISKPYEQTVGTFLDQLRSGAAASDLPASAPDRVAEIIHSLAGRDDAPTRLLLGVDAVRVAADAARAQAATDEKWYQVSMSAGH